MSEMYLGPFIGFKVLKYYNFGTKRVVSPYRETFRWWPHRTFHKAECRTGWHQAPVRTHESPDHECKCGFYAYASFDEALECRMRFTSPEPTNIKFITMVAGWGKMITHDIGFRAAKMEIVAMHKGGFKLEDQLERVAEDLDVPMLTQNAMEDYAQEIGVLLTPETLP